MGRKIEKEKNTDEIQQKRKKGEKPRNRGTKTLETHTGEDWRNPELKNRAKIGNKHRRDRIEIQTQVYFPSFQNHRR